jgi:hypothetical protein
MYKFTLFLKKYFSLIYIKKNKKLDGCLINENKYYKI